MQQHRLARFLIEEAGAPVDELSPSDRYAALHRCGGDEMGALLLDAGAAADARADDGWTPIFQSASVQYIATTRMLLDRGASIDVITSIGATPFFFFF
jgi:ankyrin repeat protein